jgi:hypothetical protein
MAMDQKTFSIVAGVIFAIVALVHLLRILLGWPVVIGDWTIPRPIWVNWIGVVVTGVLSYSGLRLGMRHQLVSFQIALRRLSSDAVNSVAYDKGAGS